jgi:D-proline reductase (dithiol) PrdB
MSDAKVRATYGDIPVFEFEETAWTTPPPLNEARVAVVTTAGLRSDGTTMWSNQDQSFTVMDTGDRNVSMSHRSQNFDRSGFLADPNLVVPTDRLQEMADAGVIGSVAPKYISFMGAQGDITLATMRLDTGPAAAQILKDDGVDVVLLTPV